VQNTKRYAKMNATRFDGLWERLGRFRTRLNTVEIGSRVALVVMV